MPTIHFIYHILPLNPPPKGDNITNPTYYFSKKLNVNLLIIFSLKILSHFFRYDLRTFKAERNTTAGMHTPTAEIQIVKCPAEIWMTQKSGKRTVTACAI